MKINIYCGANEYKYFEDYINSIIYHYKDINVIKYTKLNDIDESSMNIFMQLIPNNIKQTNNTYIINTEQISRLSGPVTFYSFDKFKDIFKKCHNIVDYSLEK